RLQGHLEPLAAKPAKEPPRPRAVRGPHARPADLARLGVDPLGRDLRTMLIKAHDDRHARSPPACQASPARSSTRALTRAASSPTHRIPWVTVGTSSSNGRPRGRHPRAPDPPFDAEDRPPSTPRPRRPAHAIVATALGAGLTAAPVRPRMDSPSLGGGSRMSWTLKGS